MPPRRTQQPREVSHEEETRLREEFLASLKAQKWKTHEIDAAEGGWEYCFDVGAEHQEDDEDAARDLAEGTVMSEPRKWRRSGKYAKEYCADLIFEGIVAARKAQGLR